MIDSRKLAAAGLFLAGALTATAPVRAQTSVPATQANATAKPAPAAQQGPNADALFIRWDTDKNKTLSIEEFKAGWQEIQLGVILRKLYANFVAMDTDKSGGLEAAEYANLELVRKAGNTAPMMAFYDIDKNGKLDFKEYSRVVTAMMKNK